MKQERIVHTTINGRDQLLTTPNFQGLLNQKNTNDASNNKQGTLLFPDDLAIAHTVSAPDAEESTGRTFIHSDTIITKFEAADLIRYLSKEETTALINRASTQLNLPNRIISYQSRNWNVTQNPLPPVTI